MKEYRYLLLFLLILSSCKKETVTDPIYSFTFASDRILQKTQSHFYVGIGLNIKEGKYKGKENFALTVGGNPTKLVKRQVTAGRIMVLFEVPGISTAGDYKAVFTYNVGSSSSTEERTIRVVNDFSLASIWDKLDQTYVKQSNFLTYVYQSKEFQFVAPPTYINNSKPGLTLDIGEYRASFSSSSNDYISKPFINGLDGEYSAYYEGGSIKEIWVSIADTYTDPFFNLNELISQLTKIYGTPVETYGKYVYSIGAFDIEVDYYRYVQVVVKKVR